MNNVYPLTFAQKIIWNTEKFALNTSINNIIGTIYFNEKLEFSLLEKAINILLKKKNRFAHGF